MSLCWHNLWHHCVFVYLTATTHTYTYLHTLPRHLALQIRVRRAFRLGHDVSDAEAFEHRAHRTTGDDARTGRGRTNRHQIGRAHSALHSPMRISYAVLRLPNKQTMTRRHKNTQPS